MEMEMGVEMLRVASCQLPFDWTRATASTGTRPVARGQWLSHSFLPMAMDRKKQAKCELHGSGLHRA